MGANFTNSNRGEYSEPPADTASGPGHRRVVYASWHPDDLELAVTWVRAFKERIEGFDCDEANVLLHSKIYDAPGEAGTELVQGRQAIADALVDVTDFVVVATARYFFVQKNQGASELGWMIESSSTGGRHVIWVAALEPNLTLKGRRLGDLDLSVFSEWHPTKSESDPWEPYSFYTPKNLKEVQDFYEELNKAVARIRGHGHVHNCVICVKAQRPRDSSAANSRSSS